MKWWHNLPLVFFSLVMPGVAIGYYLNFAGGSQYILILLTVSIVTMGLASIHLGKPEKAASALKHIQASWLSREMIFFTLLLIGFILLLLFPDSAVKGTAFVMLALGLLGTFSTIMVYRNSPRITQWPVSADFLTEALFLGTLISLNHQLMSALFLKSAKDAVICTLLYRRTEEKRWLIPGTLALITAVMPVIWPHPVALVLAIINTLILRIKFFTRIEEPTLEQSAEELRKNYMPAEYQKYFTSRNTDRD